MNTSHPQAKQIGIIDLGSNTARLIVMNAIPGYAYRLADEIREVVRLRQGLTRHGLSEDAVTRALFTLRLFKRFCDTMGVDTLIPTTTSAVREAANGPLFVERVAHEIGLSLQILDGTKEAYYATIGALNEVPMTEGVVVDIGGGSVQISQVEKRRFRRGASLTLGALALAERFVDTDPITAEACQAIGAEIERQMDTVPWLRPGKNGAHLVAEAFGRRVVLESTAAPRPGVGHPPAGP